MGQPSQRLLTATEKVSGVGYGWFKLASPPTLSKLTKLIL
jgi:hypothetical protein